MTLWLPRGYRAESEFEVKRSRFLTTLARVDAEEAAREVIADVRRVHPAARHHCSAFIVGVADSQPVERSSDDGEPAGTAGMPMLDVLRGAGVSQVVAVAARYFGGVLLGTGGLVRAYSDAVAQGLDAAPRVRPEEWAVYRLTLDLADFGRVQSDLIDNGLQIVGCRFSASAVVLEVAAAPALDVPGVVARVGRGRASCARVGSLGREAPVE